MTLTPITFLRIGFVILGLGFAASVWPALPAAGSMAAFGAVILAGELLIRKLPKPVIVPVEAGRKDAGRENG